MRKVTELCERVRSWFFSAGWGPACAWAAVLLACAAVLAWFFFVSPFGVPAAPLYAGF